MLKQKLLCTIYPIFSLAMRPFELLSSLCTHCPLVFQTSSLQKLLDWLNWNLAWCSLGYPAQSDHLNFSIHENTWLVIKIEHRVLNAFFFLQIYKKKLLGLANFLLDKNITHSESYFRENLLSDLWVIAPFQYFFSIFNVIILKIISETTRRNKLKDGMIVF